MTKGEHKVRIAEGPPLILSWLRETEQQEYVDAVSELGDSAPIDPTTPQRRQTPMQVYDEVSPTNTSFSGKSVFDAPYLPDEVSDEDPFYDDIEDLAPTKDQSWGSEDMAGPCSVESARLQDHDSASSDTGSFYSCIQPSEAVDHHETPKTTLNVVAVPPIGPDEPRFTFITSCMQCILADLPCSRTIPCCSRCKRNGYGNICLLRRQKFVNEINQSNASTCTRPVLLKLRDEDETTWAKKKQLAGELEQAWRDKEDRKNWVLPSLDGLTGNFRDNRKRRQKSSLGEGKGRAMHKELYVALDA